MTQKHKRRSDLIRRKGFLRNMWSRFYWVVLLAVIAFVALIALTSFSLSRNVINSEKNDVFAESWEYSIDGGDYSAISLPHNEGSHIESSITLKNQLPKALIKGATALVRTSQQNVEVFVGDEKIYSSFSEADKPHSSSSSYHFVRIPTDGGGKEIKVVLTSPFERYAGFISEIYLGSKASHLFFIFQQNGFRFATGLLMFCFGFLLSVVFMFAKKNKAKSEVVCLGALFACAGFWLASESRMLQFILPYPMVITNVSIFALMLIPIFWGLYYYGSHEASFKRMGKYIMSAVTAAAFGMAVIACINPMLPLYLFPACIIFMGIFVAVVLVIITIEGIKAGKLFSLSVWGGLLFGFFGLLELVFYLSNVKSFNQSNFLTAGLMIFCVLMVADAIQNFAKVYQSSLAVKALTVLAYTDSLTGIKNRTAFLERMAGIEVGHENEVTIGMFDINNLKPVNDTQGHLVGDAMLRHCAKAMKSALRQEDELYRIGGDEFAAIILHDNTLELSMLVDRIEEVMDRENQRKLSYEISVAYGYATFDENSDKTLYDTMNRADKLMYACKKKQKGL